MISLNMERRHKVLGSKIKGLLYLTGKVVDELKDPHQLMDRQRRAVLLANAQAQLRSLLFPVDKDIEEIERVIEMSVLERAGEDGVFFAVSPLVPVAMIAFPKDAEIRYIDSGLDDVRQYNPKFIIMPPTVDYKYLKRSGRYASTEGQKDASGLMVPFADRKLEDRVQHGGILANMNTGRFKLLDYNQLLIERSRQLEGDEMLIEANWYMDSSNQKQVAKRKNLLIPRAYNAVGVLSGDDRELFFTLNAAGINKEMTPLFATEFARRDVTMKEIAASCNYLANRFKAYSWAVCGLEFNTGGTFIFQAPLYRNYLMVSY